MLTGSPPFAGETHLAVLAAHGSAPRPRASIAGAGVPPAVDGVLSSAMAIDPDDRPASASALVGQLRAAAGAPDRSGAATRPIAEDPARRERSRRRGAWGLILLAGVVVAAVAAGVVLLSGSSDEGSDTGSDPVVTATIPVPRGPVSVAAGANLVWVASRNADRVTAYGPDGSTPLGRGFDVEDPRELALGFGYLWATGRDGLFRIDLGGTDIDRVLDLGDPSDLTVDDDRVWVLDRSGQPQALRFDPDTLKVDGAAFVGPDPRAIAAGAGAIWVANTGDGTVSEIDPDTAETLHRPIEVGGRPTDIAAGGGGVWAVDNFGGKLVPIDPAPPSGTPSPERPSPPGRGPARWRWASDPSGSPRARAASCSGSRSPHLPSCGARPASATTRPTSTSAEAPSGPPTKAATPSRSSSRARPATDRVRQGDTQGALSPPPRPATLRP